MPLSKEQAKAAGLAHQLHELLSLLAQCRGRLEVVDYIAVELIGDRLTARALMSNIEAISDAVGTAGEQANAALTRVKHVQEALQS